MTAGCRDRANTKTPNPTAQTVRGHSPAMLPERLSIEQMLSQHENLYGVAAGTIKTSRSGEVHAVETWSTLRSFTAPSCDFHRFNFQLSGRTSLIEFDVTRQTKHMPGALIPGSFAYIPSGTQARARIEGDPFHALQIMIPREKMQRALRHMTGAFKDDDLILGHIGPASANLLRIGQMLQNEHVSPGHGHPEMLDCLADMLCIELARHFGRPAKADTLKNDFSRSQVRCIDQMIDIALSGEIRLGDIAEALDLQPYQFTRRFKAQYGEAPRNHLLRRRLDRARDLLSGTHIPLAEIAFECGFSSQGHMTTAFSKHYGTTPSRCRSAAETCSRHAQSNTRCPKSRLA